MPEDNHGSFEFDEQDDELDDDIESVKIRVAVFFDGTLNNRTNIDQRILSQPDTELTEEERADAKELLKRTSKEDRLKADYVYSKCKAKSEDESNSYEGYYTNIAIMEKYVDSSEQYDINLQTYIEGAGSIDMEKDKDLGYMFGIFTTGIPKKVEKGIFNVVTLLNENHQNKKLIIKELTLDVFGFSRGAAAARYFIYKALESELAIRTQLLEQGYKLRRNAVKVCFVGLYDTVSAYGFWKTATGLGESNTDSLKLDAIARAKQVIQLAAADEHREFFSLTDIHSARGNSRQIFLPGVHSDIGGGYRDNVTEKQVIYEYSGYSLDAAEKELARLIDSGWYTKDEIKLEYTVGYEGDESDDSSAIRVLRKNISNKYSRIPLHLMADFAKENNIKLKAKLLIVQKIPSNLSEVKEKIDQYIKSTKESKAQNWLDNKEQWLRKLRHDYFHFSARSQKGNNPRFYEGKRERLILQG